MVASLLDTVSSDIYSESQRFVFELIQNADDAAKDSNNIVHFDFLPNSLIVSHNGKPFDENDIISLTGAGASTKKTDPTKTGYKGIGFKSVFGKSERVTIISDGYQFRFDKLAHKGKFPWQIIPIWTELKDLPSEVHYCLSKNSYKVSTIIEIKNPSTLLNDLNELLNNGQILLFLRRVSKISVSNNGMIISSIEKKIINQNTSFNEITLYKDDKEISSWITKIFEKIPISYETKQALKQDEKTPEKLKEAEFTEISFAARIEEGKIKYLKEEESLIFTYLPTKCSEFKLPFLVNGSFLTNAAREGLHEDRIWNQWLFKLVAEKIIDWLEILATGKFKFHTLQLLPIKFNSGYNPLKNSFNQSLEKSAKEKAFVLSRTGKLKKTSEIIIDETGLSELDFISPDTVIDYINQKENKKFGADSFINVQLLRIEKLRSFGATYFNIANLETFFISQSFTSRHKISENFDLIRYFKEKSEYDKQGIWFQTLKTLPFIYDEEGILRNPTNGICFPTGVVSTELGSIPIIHPEVFDRIEKDKSVYVWIKSLGVKEPSQVAFVTNVIIPSLKKEDFITVSNFLQITNYLFRLFKENLLDEEMLESLRELKLKTKNSNIIFQEAQHCYLSNKYQPQLEIEGIIADVLYLSEEYLSTNGNELEWNLFFKAIKVKDRIEVDVINNNNSLPTLRNLTSQIWVDECFQKARSFGGFGFGDHNIIREIKIPSFLNIISANYDYCKLFWKNLIGNGIKLSDIITPVRYCYGVGAGHNGYGCDVNNYFPWFIKNRICIPTTTKEILSSKDVLVNDKDIKLMIIRCCT
ncbi:hypothetical protein EZS27_029013 [termite gut metagenome]|uniref:Sacsin/Nov domain-containing protein n=1 Tax=termite gut metagenome TaxID=433724 RepID=A0A5J4QHF1_9ZZZZ